MNDAKLQKWETNNSKYLVNNQWLKLRADSCTTLDGKTIEPFYVFEYPDWVNCLVVDDNYHVIMVKHYRRGLDEYVPELISGGLEKDDASPKEGMKRELEEEIGYIGGEVFQTGVSYPNPASHTNKVYSFLAIGGSCKQAQKLEAGENLHVFKFHLRDLVPIIEDKKSGAIYQSLHLASILFALAFIKHSTITAVQKLKQFV